MLDPLVVEGGQVEAGVLKRETEGLTRSEGIASGTRGAESGREGGLSRCLLPFTPPHSLTALSPHTSNNRTQAPFPGPLLPELAGPHKA